MGHHSFKLLLYYSLATKEGKFSWHTKDYKNDKNRLRDIAKPDVLANLQQILVANPTNVSSNTFVTVLHILVIMSSHGSAVGPLLMQENIGATIRQLLVKQVKYIYFTSP